MGHLAHQQSPSDVRRHSHPLQQEDRDRSTTIRRRASQYSCKPAVHSKLHIAFAKSRKSHPTVWAALFGPKVPGDVDNVDDVDAVDTVDNVTVELLKCVHLDPVIR